MSVNEKRLDSVYKVMVTVMLPIVVFFLIRLVNTVDSTLDRQQRQEIITVGIQKDVDELKKFQERSLNMFVDYFNRKDKEEKQNK